jgi:cobalt/nickel transport system permease protein
MHIPEGIMAGSSDGREILVAAAAAAALGTAMGLYKMDYQRVPRVAMLSAVFFVASLVHVPLGLTSVHLILSGLMGLVLGWAVFPAVFCGLLLQAVFFSFGGPTTLGLNTLLMALPAVMCYYMFGRAVRCSREPLVFAAAFAAGATAILFGASLEVAALAAAGKGFQAFAPWLLVAYLPTALIEGLITGSVVVLIRKVRPELLEAQLLPVAQTEIAHG